MESTGCRGPCTTGPRAGRRALRIDCSNLRGAGFYAFHPAGAQFLMGDGSVKFIGENVKAHTFASMITRQKGEVYEELAE